MSSLSSNICGSNRVSISVVSHQTNDAVRKLICMLLWWLEQQLVHQRHHSRDCNLKVVCDRYQVLGMRKLCIQRLFFWVNSGVPACVLKFFCFEILVYYARTTHHIHI